MHATTRRRAALQATCAALVLCCLHLGGSFYEHVVIDTAWVYNPWLIDPDRSGVDRRLFWIPIQLSASLLLIVALCAGWNDRVARRPLLLAALFYGAASAWMFACWVPLGRLVEKPGDLLLAEFESARIWLFASLLSVPLVIGATWMLFRAALRFEVRAGSGWRTRLRTARRYGDDFVSTRSA